MSSSSSNQNIQDTAGSSTVDSDSVSIHLNEETSLLAGSSDEMSEQARWEALREKQRSHKQQGEGGFQEYTKPTTLLGRIRESGNLLCLVFALAVVLIVIVFALVYIFAPGAGPRAHFCQFEANVSMTYVAGRRIYQTLVSNSESLWAMSIVSKEGNGTFGNVGAHGSREIHSGSDAILVAKFFGRDVCDIIPMTTASSMCVDTTASTWILKKRKTECPDVNYPDSPFQINTSDPSDAAKKAQPRYCSMWAVDYLGLVSMVYYLDYKTHYPVRLTQKVESTSVTLDYLSFVPGKSANQAIFDYSDVSCTDYRSSQRNDGAGEATAAPDDDDGTLVNDLKRIDEINSAAVGWKAGKNSRFDGMTFADFKRQKLVQAPLLGKFLMPLARGSSESAVGQSANRVRRSSDAIPEHYDAREAWKNCTVLSEVYDQGSCGCCYAMAAVETLADRICIASAGKEDTPLSVQWVIGCHTNLMGCSGGWADVMWKNLVMNGTTTRDCVSFLESDSECPTICDNGKTLSFVNAKSAVNTFSVYLNLISFHFIFSILFMTPIRKRTLQRSSRRSWIMGLLKPPTGCSLTL